MELELLFMFFLFAFEGFGVRHANSVSWDLPASQLANVPCRFKDAERASSWDDSDVLQRLRFLHLEPRETRIGLGWDETRQQG